MFKKIICFCLTLILFVAFCLNAFAYVEYDYYDIESIITNHLPMYADLIINNYIRDNFSADYPYIIIKPYAFDNNTYFRSFPPIGYGSSLGNNNFVNDDYYIIYNDSIVDSDGYYKPIIFTYDGKISNWSKISSFGFVVDDTDSSQREFRLKSNNYRFFDGDDYCYNMYINSYDICIIHKATYTNSSETMIFSNTSSNSYNIDSEVYYGETDSETLTETDSESEYHGGVLGWFSQIYNGITGLGTSIGNFFTNLGTTISNLFTSLWQKLIDLKDGILNGLKTLFIPTVNPFSNLLPTFRSKYPIIDQIYNLLQIFVDSSTYSNSPSFDLTIFGVQFNFNFNWYVNYRPMINGILLTIIYFTYAVRLFKRLPSIIGGFADTNNSSTTIQQ